ncbi:hypothetical protein K0M31_008271 [Melipona bicolor]|uniref:Uncharacterized protein n=1 Tax=Melipona bicolor TaxID=60889 RepID=A0AA40FRE0_9HYME|nr:hypothetical protein K0M31_008271 [Melipona bicolor]
MELSPTFRSLCRNSNVDDEFFDSCATTKLRVFERKKTEKKIYIYIRGSRSIFVLKARTVPGHLLPRSLHSETSTNLLELVSQLEGCSSISREPHKFRSTTVFAARKNEGFL